MLRPSFGVCPQCGLSHPPVAPGEICPMAEDKSGVDFSKFFKDLKNICKNHISKKEIKDHKKFFGLLTIEIQKVLDNFEIK